MDVAIQSVVGVAMVPEAILEKLEPMLYQCDICSLVNGYWTITVQDNFEIEIQMQLEVGNQR